MKEKNKKWTHKILSKTKLVIILFQIFLLKNILKFLF